MKTNIITKLKDGYSIAQTPTQLAKVKRWHKKVSKTVANCHTMLDECDRLDAEFDKVARRMGLIK